MQKLPFLSVLIALLASTTVFAKIAGTYVLEVEGMGAPGEGSEVTLTLAADDDGEYSASVNTPMGQEGSESVEVDGNEFSFLTKVESRRAA